MALSTELTVKCLICNEIIKCQHNDTSKLLDHVDACHPDLKISDLPKELKIKPKSNVKSRLKKKKKIGSKQAMEAEGNKIPKYTSENGKTKKDPFPKRKKFYKTSVETWKPGRDKILCPKCDTIVRPIIRRSADRVSHSSVGAALIMTCWPFCFFPFLFPAPIQENLHCSICGYFFGTYDYQNQTMKLPKEIQQPQHSKKEENLETAQGGYDRKQTMNVPNAVQLNHQNYQSEKTEHLETSKVVMEKNLANGTN